MIVRERALSSDLIDPPADWAAVPGPQMRGEHPDAHLSVEDGELLRARCSLWWRDVPRRDGDRVGIVGHFGARNEAAAIAALDAACRRLHEEGCTIAIGPMDGNTWRRYRLVTEPGSAPPFLLEPTNPVDWPAYFEAAGFATIAEYRSLVATDLSTPDPRTLAREPELRAAGISIRALAMDDFDAELRRIHAVARVAFADNFLYTPISETEFIGQYQKVKALVDPSLVLLGMDESRIVGFAFGIPDPTRESSADRTFIVKTIAILPERERYAGLGRVLVSHLNAAAHARGYTRAIHALIHDANHSRTISERTATVMRRYALYARRLST